MEHRERLFGHCLVAAPTLGVAHLQVRADALLGEVLKVEAHHSESGVCPFEISESPNPFRHRGYNFIDPIAFSDLYRLKGEAENSSQHTPPDVVETIDMRSVLEKLINRFHRLVGREVVAKL